MFHNDIKNLSEILKRNMFPKCLLTNQLKVILVRLELQEKTLPNVKRTSNCFFYKLPYIGYYSSYTKRKIPSIINEYCEDLNVKIIFPPFKLSTMLSPNDFVPDSLKSPVVYQFTCASCGARYIGETNRHFNTSLSGQTFPHLCF